MKLITKILLGIAMMGVMAATTNIDTITWFKVGQLEKKSLVRIPSSQIIAGDSTIIYSGAPAVLSGVSIKYVPYLTAYTTTGSSDTVKIYSTYNNIPVQIGYILDDLYEGNIPTLTYSSTNIGGVDGTLYYIITPPNKFTVGDAYLDIICNWITFK